MTRLSAILFAATIASLIAWAPAGPPYDIDWYSIDGGGGVTTGGAFTLHSVIGQHDAGATLSGGTFTLAGGYLASATLPCPADIDGNGAVDVMDLLDLLGAWGACAGGPCPADLNGDGMVDVLDLLDLLGAWGPCP